MECQLRFAPLPRPHSRCKSLLIGWVLQVQLVLAAVVLNAMFPKHNQQLKRYVVMNLVAPAISVTQDRRPVNGRVAVQAMQQPIVETPMITKLVVPRQVRAIREPQAKVNAPQIELTSKTPDLPTLPNPPIGKIVATNRFTNPTNSMSRTTKPSAQVQTGSFGDSNRIPTGGEKPGLNIAAKADIRDAGFGDGLSGVRGVEISGNVVQLSGFDKQYDAATSKQTVAVTHELSSPVEIIGKPKPSYTEEARKLGIEGEVRLEVQFTFDGHVRVLRVLQGLGFGLDEQALRCAEQIRFKPAMHGGQPIDSRAIVHIVFELAS